MLYTCPSTDTLCMRSNSTSLIGPSLGASSSNEFETLGDSLMTIAPLVIKLEMASTAVSVLWRKSSQP